MKVLILTHHKIHLSASWIMVMYYYNYSVLSN